MMNSDGDSRRSSVRALNVSPHTATVLPSRRPAGGERDLVDDAVVLLVVDGDHAAQQVEGVAAVLGHVNQRPRVFGKQVPPQPGPGRRNSKPMRLS